MEERRDAELEMEVAREPRVPLAGRRSPARDDPVWELVRTHEATVAWLAREYRHLGIPVEDLRGEGMLGLIEAALRFDPSRGVKFITYGLWWARKRMCETALRQVGIVRLPRYRLRRLSALRHAERELTFSIGRPPTTEEIARESGMPVREVELLLGFCRREVSLSERVNEFGTLRIEETIEDPNDTAPDDDLMKRDRESFLTKLLGRLPIRQRQVLAWRFGLDGRPRKTLSEIGKLLGLSRERVRQLERSALQSLRRQSQETRAAR